MSSSGGNGDRERSPRDCEPHTRPSLKSCLSAQLHRRVGENPRSLQDSAVAGYDVWCGVEGIVGRRGTLGGGNERHLIYRCNFKQRHYCRDFN